MCVFLWHFYYETRSMSKPEVAGEAKLSLGGSDLSPHVVDVIFALFDKAGDGALSHDEFFTVLTNRQKRRLGRIGARRAEEPWAKKFAKCVRKEIRKAPEQQIRMDV